jgi:hypothetical protein
MHLLSNQLSGYRQCCGRKPIVHYLDDTGTELSWGAILRLPPGSAGILVVRPEPLDDFRARSVEEQTGPVGRYLGTRSPLEMTPAQGDGRLFDAQGPRSLVARGFSFTDDRAQRSSLYAQIGHYTLTNLTHPNAPDGLIFPPNPLEVCLLPRRSASSLGRSNEMCAWKDGHIDDRHQRFLVVAATLQPGVSKKNLMSLGQVEVKSSLMQPILDWAEELRDSKGLPLRCKTETHAEKIETGGSDAYTIHSTTDDLHLCLREFYLRHPDDPHDHDRVTFLAQWIRYPDSRFQGSSFTIDPNDSMPVTWHRIFDSAQRNPGFLASLLAASIAVHPHRTSVSVLVEYRNAQSELCTHDELADVRAGDTCSLTLARGPTLHPVATVTRAGKSGTADTSVRSVQSVSAASTAALAVSRDPARFSEMFPVIGNQESGPDSPHMADEVATPSRKGPSTDGLTWANVVQGRSQGPEKGQADGGPEGQRGKLGEAETSGVLAQAGAADEISSATESEEPVCAAPESTTAAPSWARILRDGKATSDQDGQRPETSSQKTQSGKAGVSWARIVGRAV